MFFKKKKCKLKHTKDFGEAIPENMKTILGFTEYKHTHIEDYKILECSECRTRAYLGDVHCMGSTAETIDKFIRHEIDLSVLLQEFEQRKYRYVNYKPTKERYETDANKTKGE